MEGPRLLETYYEEREGGEIVKCYRFKGEELATKSDVYGWHRRGMAYTDSCDTKCKVAIGVSIASIIISLAACIMCLVS